MAATSKNSSFIKDSVHKNYIHKNRNINFNFTDQIINH